MTRVLVCRLCDNSFSWQVSELPDTCPVCREPAHWRVAEKTEWTNSDKRLLKAYRILAD